MARTWFITGTSSGFGFEIAKHALEKGDNVVGTARKPETLKELSDAYPENFLAVALDVTDSQAIQNAVKAANEWNSVDIVVNNAGIGAVGAWEEMDVQQVRSLFDVNVFGLYEVTRAFLPRLRSQGSGHIINFSSIAGLMSMSGFGAYCATKFAVEAFTESLAQEVAEFGIKVTAIEPGAFKTSFVGHNIISAPEMSEYKQSSGATRQMLTDIGQSAAGDPIKAADVVFQVSQMSQPPMRLLLGSDALQWAKQKHEMLGQQISAHEDLTTSTNFD